MSANCIALNRRSAKEQHEATSSRKNHARKGRQIKALRIPPGKIIKAQAMLIQGDSQREIARTLHMSEHSVAKIVRTEDFQNFLKEQQERVFGIVPIAIESFRAEVATNGILAHTFLKGLGIIPTHESIAQFLNTATPQTESGEERQARMLAAVLLEGHKNYGIDLPEDFDAAMAKDSQKSQEARMSRPKLLRK
jgi:hypothetical protein